MKQLGLGTKLRHVLAKLDGEVQAIYDEQVLEFKPRFYSVALKLSEEGPASVNEIARDIGVSQPAATQTIQEMERIGLVEMRATTDRRTRLVALSSRGKRTVAQLQPIWAAVARAAEELDRELPASLAGTIDAALAALEDRPFGARIQHQILSEGRVA